MVPDIALNTLVLVVTLSTIACAFLAVVLFVIALARRASVIARVRSVASLMEQWRSILKRAASTDEELPRIRYCDAFAVLNLWNDLQHVRRDGMDEHIRARLNQIGRRRTFGRVAKALLRNGRTGDRVVALTTLGYVCDPEDLTLVEQYVNDPRGEVSFAACRALVMISPAEIGKFMEALLVRDDWSATAVERFLKDLGPALISAPLRDAIETSEKEQDLGLLRYLRLCDLQIAHDATLNILSSGRETGTIIRALRELCSLVQPGDRPLLYRFLRDERTYVRLAAVRALLPIAGPEDEPIISGLLSDPNPWIRYRSAQVLVAIPGGVAKTQQLSEQSSDRFSRDILVQALAERDLNSRVEAVGHEHRRARRTTGPFDRRTLGLMRHHK